MKSRPQKFKCKDCEIIFYSYTSSIYQDLTSEFNDFFIDLFKNGKLNLDSAKQALNCSKSNISHMLKTIMEQIFNSILVKNAWKSPVSSNVFFVDETWIKIMNKNWYIVIVVDEEHRILAWDLIKKRESDIILQIIKKAISRLETLPYIIVTDDFSTYKRVVKDLGYDLIHVRHIHKPPYNRMVIDIINHNEKTIKITHGATTTDIFCDTNVFIIHTSESEVKKTTKGKKGRKLGSKNKPKLNKQMFEDTQIIMKKKRGPKNPYKDAVPNIYMYNKDDKLVKPLYGSDFNIGRNLNRLAKYFAGICITTNPVEQQFSVLKSLVNFRGKRSVQAWIRILNFYFSIREYPEITRNELHGLRLGYYILNRSLDLKVKLLFNNHKIMSEVKLLYTE